MKYFEGKLLITFDLSVTHTLHLHKLFLVFFEDFITIHLWIFFCIFTARKISSCRKKNKAFDPLIQQNLLSQSSFSDESYQDKSDVKSTKFWFKNQIKKRQISTVFLSLTYLNWHTNNMRWKVGLVDWLDGNILPAKEQPSVALWAWHCI